MLKSNQSLSAVRSYVYTKLVFTFCFFFLCQSLMSKYSDYTSLKSTFKPVPSFLIYSYFCNSYICIHD